MIKVNQNSSILINFKPLRNCVGQKIIGEFFEIGVQKIGDANSIPIEEIDAVVGKLTSEEIEFPIDTTNLTEDTLYSLVLRTAETGVIYINQIYVNYAYN